MRHSLSRACLASCLASSFALALGARAGAQDSFALYDVEFQATWSAATHPASYPLGAHFSKLVGGTHGGAISFWSPGAIATPGIEAMAELGATGPLAAEVNLAIGLGFAHSVVLGSVNFPSPGSTTASFFVTEDHPRITLVSMIAPSPDWFVGVHDLPLLVDGEWIETLTAPLVSYDAGTDSGTTFLGPDVNTVPKQPIAPISSGLLSEGVPLGTLTFRRRLSTLVYGSGVNPAGSLTVLAGAPRIGQTITLGLSDPSGTMAQPATTILAATDDRGPFFPAGILIGNIGLSMPGAPGEYLLGVNVVETLNGPSWTGTTVPLAVPIPNLAALIDVSFYLQGILVAPTPRIGVTEAIELHVGP